MAKESNARFLQYLGPVIEALQKLGNSARPREVLETIEENIEVDPEYLERKHKSGQTVFENDVHWCRMYLVKSGYIDSSKRGVWTLTPKGKNLVVDNSVTEEIFRTVQQTFREKKAASTPEDYASADKEIIEEIDDELDGHDYRAAALEKLKSLSPQGFERFCQGLLREAGFEDVEVTGRSGDRGIDGHGTLKVNSLFSMKMGFQAKRYQDSVGSGVVRDFRGAIVGRVDRGLLITTGRFTKDAKAEAARDGATQIELVDGLAILDLMEEFEFGLKAVSTFELIDAKFDEFET